jgi:hypothetical protein
MVHKSNRTKTCFAFLLWLTAGCRDQAYDGNALAERYCDCMGEKLC